MNESAPLGCSSPGLAARLGPGRPRDPLLAAHLAECLACQLERAALARLAALPAEDPPAALRARLAAVAREAEG